jgi:hypothetical protein
MKKSHLRFLGELVAIKMHPARGTQWKNAHEGRKTGDTRPQAGIMKKSKEEISDGY